MQGAESQLKDSASGGRARRLRFASLILIVLVLFGSSFVSLRTQTAQSSQDSAKLMVDTLFRTRSLYSARPAAGVPALPEYQKRAGALISDLVRLANLSPSPRTIRRLALTQYALGDSGWRDSLLRLRALPGTGPTFDTERELSL